MSKAKEKQQQIEGSTKIIMQNLGVGSPELAKSIRSEMAQQGQALDPVRKPMAARRAKGFDEAKSNTLAAEVVEEGLIESLVAAMPAVTGSLSDVLVEGLATKEVLEEREVQNDDNAPKPILNSQLSQAGPNQAVQQSLNKQMKSRPELTVTKQAEGELGSKQQLEGSKSAEMKNMPRLHLGHTIGDEKFEHKKDANQDVAQTEQEMKEEEQTEGKQLEAEQEHAQSSNSPFAIPRLTLK